jgi:hypothetical protein
VWTQKKSVSQQGVNYPVWWKRMSEADEIGLTEDFKCHKRLLGLNPWS